MNTPLLHTAYGAERDTIVKNRAAILPGRRVGTADEVAQVILMLMTNDYMTGEVVHVDGGGRFVSQCSIDTYIRSIVRQYPYPAGDAHPSAVPAAQVNFNWRDAGAENECTPAIGALYDGARGA